MAATPPQPNPDPTFDVERIVARLKKNIGILLGCLILAVAIGLGYTFLTPAKYEARTTLFFPNRIPSVLGQSGVADQAGQSLLGTGPTPLKIFRAFIESQTALDYVAAHSGMERQKIVDIRGFSEDASASILTVSIVLPDKEEGKKLLDLHIAALGLINSNVSEKYVHDETQTLAFELQNQKRELARVRQERLEFEKTAGSAPSVGVTTGLTQTTVNKWQEQLLAAKVQLKSISAELDMASERFRAAAGQGGESPIDIPPVRRLRPQLVDAEYQLRLLRRSLGEDAPEVDHLKKQIGAIQQELSMELAKYLSSVKKGLLDPTEGNAVGGGDMPGILLHQVALEAEIKALTILSTLAPGEASALAKLDFGVSLQSELVRQATLQLQNAKLLALRDPNKWSLLDPPRIMEKPVNKRYGMVAVACTAIGLFVGILWAMNFGRRPD